MNPEAQRIAIAEACGMKWTLSDDGWWDGPSGNEGISYERMLDRLPDYLNDLNAMHEVEKALFGPKWVAYVEHLSRLCPGYTSAYHATAGGDFRLQVNAGTWHTWQGDPQYDTDHRGAWASAFVPWGCTRNESMSIARELLEECE
jgi:hypothetical protein